MKLWALVLILAISVLMVAQDPASSAVFHLSAWYDDNYGPEGATTNYAGLLKSREGDKDARTHLLLGPWVHGVDNTEKTRSGEREFGSAAAIDYDEVW